MGGSHAAIIYHNGRYWRGAARGLIGDPGAHLQAPPSSRILTGINPEEGSQLASGRHPPGDRTTHATLWSAHALGHWIEGAQKYRRSAQASLRPTLIAHIAHMFTRAAYQHNFATPQNLNSTVAMLNSCQGHTQAIVEVEVEEPTFPATTMKVHETAMQCRCAEAQIPEVL